MSFMCKKIQFLGADPQPSSGIKFLFTSILGSNVILRIFYNSPILKEHQHFFKKLNESNVKIIYEEIIENSDEILCDNALGMNSFFIF